MLTGVLQLIAGAAKIGNIMRFVSRSVMTIIRVRSEYDAATDTRHVQGQVFFVSCPEFLTAFDFKEALAMVRIDVSHAHFWHLTSAGADGTARAVERPH